MYFLLYLSSITRVQIYWTSARLSLLSLWPIFGISAQLWVRYCFCNSAIKTLISSKGHFRHNMTVLFIFPPLEQIDPRRRYTHFLAHRLAVCLAHTDLYIFVKGSSGEIGFPSSSDDLSYFKSKVIFLKILFADDVANAAVVIVPYQEVEVHMVDIDERRNTHRETSQRGSTNHKHSRNSAWPIKLVDRH